MVEGPNPERGGGRERHDDGRREHESDLDPDRHGSVGRYAMMRLVPKSSAPLSGRTLSVIPYIALLAYGLAFAAAAIGAHLPVYDDHPGQLYRLRHVLTHGPAPWAWNPGWWTGYPEL